MNVKPKTKTIPLVPNSNDVQTVVVFQTSDAGVAAVAKTLLESEQIDYFVRGEGLLNVFGWVSGGGPNYVVGPAEFLVRERDAARAIELLAELK